VCDKAAQLLLDTAELYKPIGYHFNVTKINCWEFPDPCLDHGVKKRYPFLGLYAFPLLAAPVF
jgi:hypothetical protein